MSDIRAKIERVLQTNYVNACDNACRARNYKRTAKSYTINDEVILKEYEQQEAEAKLMLEYFRQYTR